MNLGEKINYYRESRGLTQAELGAELFVTRQTVSLWEKGQTLPSLDNIVRLAEIFGVTIDELLRADIPSADSEKKKLSEVDKNEILTNAENEVKANVDNEAFSDDKRKTKERNKCLRFITNKYAILTFVIIVMMTVSVVFLTRNKKFDSVTDENIEKVIGTDLPKYKSRTVINKVKGSERVNISAVTEILFEDNISDKLSATMNNELPNGIDNLIDSVFIYKGCELYAVYDSGRERRISEVTERGDYIFASYDRETKILRITEFEYK